MFGHDSHHGRPKSTQAVDQPPTPARFQFSLRSVFALMTAVAIICAMYRFAGIEGAVAMFVACVLGFSVLRNQPSAMVRHANAAMFGCILLGSAFALPVFHPAAPPNSGDYALYFARTDVRLTLGMWGGTLMGGIVAIPYGFGLARRFGIYGVPANRRSLFLSLWLGPTTLAGVLSVIYLFDYLFAVQLPDTAGGLILVTIMTLSFLLGRFVAPWLFTIVQPTGLTGRLTTNVAFSHHPPIEASTPSVQ